jgi:hypothetical protein
MRLALLYPEPEKGGRGKTVLKRDGFSKQRLSDARALYRYSRELALAVRDGPKTLVTIARDLAVAKATKPVANATTAESPSPEGNRSKSEGNPSPPADSPTDRAGNDERVAEVAATVEAEGVTPVFRISTLAARAGSKEASRGEARTSRPALTRNTECTMSQANSRSTPNPSPKPSRRAVLAGVAAAPVLAVPALALSGTGRPREGGDPIFAAIERHKAAYRIQMEAGRIRCHTADKWSPEYDPVECEAAKEAYTAAADASDDAAADASDDAAADALTTIRPTTMAGVLALLHHVEAFNAGAFFLDPWPDSTVGDWQSKPTFWPSWEDEDGIDLFGYAVLANVRAALEAMAGVS